MIYCILGKRQNCHRRYQKKLKQFKEKLNRNFGVEKLVLFGSRASHNFNKYSDFDFIVVSDAYKNINTLNRPGKTYDYWNLDFPVDFLCFTHDEIEKKKNMPGIIKNALETGIEI